MENIIGDYRGFVKRAECVLDKYDLQKTDLAMLDHLCYGVNKMERFYEISKEMLCHAKIISDKQNKNRLVRVFQFHYPLVVSGWIIPWFELQAPKEQESREEGLCHVEFITKSNLYTFQNKNSSVHFAYKDRTLNPSLSLQEGGLCLNFHEISIGAVVGLEKRLVEKDPTIAQVL